MDIPLKVLGHKEEGEWILHALELDLFGVGPKIEEAKAALIEAIEAQLDYCDENGLTAFHPAPPEYFERWEEGQREAMSERQSRCFSTHCNSLEINGERLFAAKNLGSSVPLYFPRHGRSKAVRTPRLLFSRVPSSNTAQGITFSPILNSPWNGAD